MADHSTGAVEAGQAEVGLTPEFPLERPAPAGVARPEDGSPAADHFRASGTGQVELHAARWLAALPAREHAHARGRIVDALADESLAHAQHLRKAAHQN